MHLLLYLFVYFYKGIFIYIYIHIANKYKRKRTNKQMPRNPFWTYGCFFPENHQNSGEMDLVLKRKMAEKNGRGSNPWINTMGHVSKSKDDGGPGQCRAAPDNAGGSKRQPQHLKLEGFRFDPLARHRLEIQNSRQQNYRNDPSHKIIGTILSTSCLAYQGKSTSTTVKWALPPNGDPE